ncbi:hypothetical protein O9992_05315 [Vibrio lentus]|nr:hypothetical protein [Vibrio lentus]
MPEPIGVEFKNTYNLLELWLRLKARYYFTMMKRVPTVSDAGFLGVNARQKETGNPLRISKSI